MKCDDDQAAWRLDAWRGLPAAQEQATGGFEILEPIRHAAAERFWRVWRRTSPNRLKLFTTTAPPIGPLTFSVSIEPGHRPVPQLRGCGCAPEREIGYCAWFIGAMVKEVGLLGPLFLATVEELPPALLEFGYRDNHHWILEGYALRRTPL